MTSPVLWYLNRATGIVSLLLMTLTVVLGTVVRRHGRIPGLPRFAVTGLHRNVGLLSALLLVTHVLTAVVDSYVDIGVANTVVPFTAGYRPLAIGLGTLAADLLLLVIVTSLLRERLPHRLWKAVHLTSYLLWPLAFVHGITAGTDLGSGWLLAVVLTCAAAATWASVAALGARRASPPPAERAAAALTTTSAALSTGNPVAVFRNG
ncbi:MAG: ferric reductase [Blastococcus sp.]|nr:ferric reductase [Blastococcus sp.]